MKQLKIKCFLLQKNYGLPYDCTLTSITTLIHNLPRSNYIPNYVYGIVEKQAKKYFYDGNKFGTLPVFIKNIINASLKALGRTEKSAVGYLKGVGFNFNTIKKLIDDDKIVILSIATEKQHKYNNHTVTVIGYDDNQNLILADNWTKTAQLFNYNRLNTMSCINYLK